MSDLLCKLWMQLRRILKSGVQFAASTAKTVSKVAIGILKDVVKAVDDALEGVFGSGGASSFFMWAALGVGAYFLLTREREDEPSPRAIAEEAQASRSAATPPIVGGQP